jgi:hypothetical protein
VTCEDLWRRGWLKPEAYSHLADAIRRRADEIIATTVDASGQSAPRPPIEQAALLNLF